MPLFTVLSFRTPKSAENLKIFSINSWKSTQCMFYIRLLYLRQTTEGDHNTPFDVSAQKHTMQPGEWSHSGKVIQELDVVDKKRDCFLVCFVQNIRYLVGTSDVTTVSNDLGNILQTSCKTSLKKESVLPCSANAWIRTHATFLVIPKRCCHFSVVQSFQFEFTTHLTYLQGKHSWSVDQKYNYRECLCYIIRIKQCFLRTNQWLLLHVLAICLYAKWQKSLGTWMSAFGGNFSALFSNCVMTILKSTTAWLLKLSVLYIHSFMHIHNTTFQIKKVFNNVLFSAEVGEQEETVWILEWC